MRATLKQFALLIAVFIFVFYTPFCAFAQDMRPMSAALATKIAASGRKTVAVVDFTDLQGCVTELGRYMAEDISVALLDNAKGFEVIDRTNLKILMQEHKLASTGIIDPSTARKLGQVAGVDVLVTGTIAPLSDSVHVSAKVLDTETAKMLGGVTADIPRTRTVEELLAKSVSFCGSTPTSPIGGVGGPHSQGGITQAPPKPQAVGTGQIGDFAISIVACRRAAEWVKCSGTIVNSGTQRQRFHIDTGKSYMVDNLANQSRQPFMGDDGGISASVGSGIDGQIAEPDLPLKFSVSGHGLSDEAVSLTIILSTNEPSGRITLRNIPIQVR